MEILTKKGNIEIILPCLHDYRMQTKKEREKKNEKI